MSKQFWAIIAIIILGFGAIAVFSGGEKDKAVTSSAKPSNHVLGEGTTGVTLTEYGDFECPYCLQSYPAIKQVVADYGDRIKFQFRNFPLTSIHQNAFAASRAAEAAGMQGKFFEMHDLLYEDRSWVGNSNPTAVFDRLAGQLSLDVTKFKADFASSKVNSLVNADLEEAQRLKLTSTPSYFINGKPFSPKAIDPAEFKKAIDAEIKKQEASNKTTAPTTTTEPTPAPTGTMAP